jgi:aryl-alcohol dehydrogenase-like predicted oxidoreductase
LTGATSNGTEAFRVQSLKHGAAPGHFREVEGLQVSSLGIGTYLGENDAPTDELYRAAVIEVAGLGGNLIDSAINYRCQRSERAVGRALKDLGARGVARDRFVVCTKGGYIPYDGAPPPSATEYLRTAFYEKNLLRPEEVVSGHSLAPRFLSHQLETSLANLGLDTVDVYYLHNPETQLRAVERSEFRARLASAFEMLEKAADEGRVQFYGAATWNGFRVNPRARDFLSLAEVVSVAREVGGEGHRFRFVQAPYSLAMTEIFTENNQPDRDATLSLCQAGEALGVHVIASASLAQGQLKAGLPDWLGKLFRGLRTDAQRALQFVRSTPGVSAALVGMKSPEHVRENLEVARIPPAAVDDFLKLFEVDSRGDRRDSEI